MYQFRFSGKESDISDIFKETEISKAFETAFMNNYEILLNRIREYKTFILSNSFPDYILSSFSIVLSEDEIISNFKELLKRNLLYAAMQDVFSSKFNVKKNILEMLQGSFIKNRIMGQSLLNSFEDIIVTSTNSSVALFYYFDDVLEELESEFLQK